MDLTELQELFVKERRYLNNVSPKTLEWYKYSFRAFAPQLKDCPPQELRAALKNAVMALSARKLQASSINDYIRALNAFLQWAKAEGHLAELIRLERLREEQRLIPTLNSGRSGPLSAGNRPASTKNDYMRFAVCCLTWVCALRKR
jgi:hypothetical protein